ncbi:hypothetical protein D9M69_630680 [compost metagenome]
MVDMMSLYSPTILSCSSPVRRCRRMFRISWACVSLRRYMPSPWRPNSTPRSSGRKAARPPGVSPSARDSISRTRDESHDFAISSWRATGGVGAALMIAMKSSMLASATARPSSTWPRSRALRNWNTVRRVTTSRRCCRK